MAFNYRFSVIPAGAIIDTRLTARALQVLCLLGRHTNDAGWCSRSQVKMAGELKCGRATIYDALELLVETGWVEKKVNGRGGRAHKEGEQPFAAYSYRVVLDREILPAAMTSEDQALDNSEFQSTSVEGGAAQAAGGAAQAAGGAGPEAAPLEGLPSEGIPSELERENARAREHEEFAKWLSAFTLRWPTAAADDQTRIANAGRALTRAERQEALAGIPAFLDHIRKLGRTRVPGGWNYLEQKRWTLMPASRPDAAAHSQTVAAEGDVQFRIYQAIYRISKPHGGFPYYMVSGVAPNRRLSISKALPEELICLADENLTWREVEEGSGSFASWMRWLSEHIPINHVTCGRRGDKRTLTVPSDWPPRKDGSIGPPSESQSAA